jgi:transposase-like protein
MVKTIQLEGREEDMKRLILAFQERKPADWAKYIKTKVECPICGGRNIRYTEEDVWVCQGCNSGFERLEDDY